MVQPFCCLYYAYVLLGLDALLDHLALHLMDSIGFQRCAMSMLVLEKIKKGTLDAILKEKLRLINFPKAITCVLSECLEQFAHLIHSVTLALDLLPY